MGRLQPLAGPLILASASPRRRLILRRLRLPFRVVPSRASEKSREKDPRKLVVLLARRKALNVARRFHKALVLGADTIVVCRGEIIGKPRDRKDSGRILRLLNGRWQTVYTGVALACDGGRRVLSSVATTRVLAHRLDERRLTALAGKHMDKAGAYAVQDRNDPFVERISGDFDNVVGLPLDAVRRLLSRARYALAEGRVK